MNPLCDIDKEKVMVGNRPIRFSARALVALMLLLTTAAPLFAQVRKVTPLDNDDEHGKLEEEEGRKWPKIPVNPEVFNAHDEWFRETAKKIQDGSATIQERRAYWEMSRMYYPFTTDSRPPANWRVNAYNQAMQLDPSFVARQAAAAANGAAPRPKLRIRPEAASDYLWSGLGQNAAWYQGQPPTNDVRTGTPDWGSGRGTAVWVNPNNKSDVLVGTACGGVWKTTKMSATKDDVNAIWTPLTDTVPSLSVGSLVAQVSPTDGNRLGPNTKIWVATGEGNFAGGDVQGIGILKSVDGGATWQVKQIPWYVAGDGTTMFDRTSIRRIALDGRNPNNLWIAADSGIYRSTDAGETWRLVQGLPYWKKFNDCWYVYWTDLVIDDVTPAAGQPSIVYAAHGRVGNAGCSALSREDNGIYRSSDDGTTWSSISVPNANCPGVVAGTTSRGYNCVGSGFAASGLTNSTTVNGNVGRVTIVQAPGNKKHLYALMQNQSTNNSLGVWETTDSTLATVTWTARSTTNFTGSQAWYAIIGAVNPTNDAQIIVGGLDMYVSGNNAATLNKTSSWNIWGVTSYAHADQHHAVWVKGTTPKDNGTTDANDWIFLMNDGGFIVGTVTGTGVNGVTWATNNRGMMTGQSYGIGQSATQAHAIHVGNQDNGEPKATLTAGNITTWWESRGGDGGFSATSRTNDAQALQEYVYAGIYSTINMAYTNSVPTWTCRTNFGACTTCNGSCVPDNATEFIAPLTLDRNNQARAYTGSRYVYRLINAFTGNTWVRYSPDLTTTNDANDIINIHSAFNNGTAGTIYAVTFNGKVWKTTNGTCDTANCATWTNVTTATLPARTATWVETDPNNANRAYLTFSGFNTGHVFRTTDGGTNWTDVSGLLPNEPFDAIAVDPSNVNRVFVASDMGVFVNEDAWNTNNWMRVNNGVLPLGKIYMLQYSPANGKLRAVTHGRGVWELTVSPGSACGGSTPAQPTGVTATPSSGQVLVSWNAVAGATTYKVYRNDNTGCPTSDLGHIVASGVTTTSFTDVTSCTGTYAYRVIALNAANCESPASACVNATMPAQSAPATLTATPAGSGQISLGWAAVSGASTYEVWRYNNSTCPAPNNGTQVASGITGTAYTDTGLTNGTPYAYYVRVTTSCPGAPFSPCATATPVACSPLAAPASVSATATAPNRITVTWSTVVGASSYKVYRASGACVASDPSYTLLQSGVAGTSFNDNTVTFGNRYSYKVVTTTSCDSALSTSCAWAEAYGDCVAAPTFAGAATAATSGSTTCGIDLTWALGSSNCPGAGSISYTIYRGTSPGVSTVAANRIVAGVSSTTYTDANSLQAGVTYYYKVRAVDSRNNVEDGNTAERSAVAQVACTAAPYDVQVFTVTATGGSGAGSGQNVLSWLNPASGAPGTTVRVNFRTDSVPTGPNDPAATVLFTGRAVTFGAKDSFTHSGLTNGTTYYYAIWVLY